MFDYIKMLIISFISAVFAPLPVSYGANYSFLNKVLGFSTDTKIISLYFAVISIVFALVAIFNFRKIYSRGIKSVFSKNQGQAEKSYKKYMLNVLISLISAASMFIPYSKGKFVIDIFENMLNSDYFWVTAGCCIGSGLILFVAMWYTKQNYDSTHRSAKPMNIIRFSIYQIPAYIFPGLSNIAVGSSGMLISDIDPETTVREVLMFFSPSVLVINVARLIRVIFAGVVLNPIMIVVAVIGSAVGSAVMLHIISRINIRKTFVFFSIYSILFGLLITVYSFVV